MLAVHNTLHAPPTPPYTSTFHTKTTTTLPPICNLTMQPLTPPDDSHDVGMLPAKLPMPLDIHLIDWLDVTRTLSAQVIAEKTCEMICYLWHARPSTSSPTTQSSSSAYPSPSNSPPSSALTHTSVTASPSPHPQYYQLVPKPDFISFLQKILETTQVSQSVIVLSLHYIYKLKEMTGLWGPPGSEFRIAVAGLMMANKFLDDNTYTNKTWAEVSGIDLVHINEMEKDFLLGVNYNLYVDKATFEAWLNLLKGLVMAKERDLRAREPRRNKRKVGTGGGHGYAHTPSRARYYRVGNGQCGQQAISVQHVRHVKRQPRARSTSPNCRSFFVPQPSQSQQPAPQLPPIQTHLESLPTPSHIQPLQPQPQFSYNHLPYNYSPSPAPSSLKRSAETAFSPTSASFAHLPNKRTSIAIDAFSTDHVLLSTTNHSAVQRPGITLQIPNEQRSMPPHSNSPLDNLPLQGFAKMSLASALSAPPPSTAPAYVTPSSSSSLSSALGPMPNERPVTSSERRYQQFPVSSTLIQPYAYSLEEQQRKGGHPRNLYFYTLACSPLEYSPGGKSRMPSPQFIQQPEVYTPEETMDREQVMEQEFEREQERQRQRVQELERERERELEKEKERERLRKARLRVHRPPSPSSIRYSDYAYMPFVSATTATRNPVMNSSYPVSCNPASTMMGQSQSARTSPVANAGRHFDAVRFEVERTQRRAPSTSRQQSSTHTPSQPQSQVNRSPVNTRLRSNHTHFDSQPTKGRNPYPQLSPPTPVTSTSTSPVTFGSVSNKGQNIVDNGYPTAHRGYAAPYISSHSNPFEEGRCCVSAYTSPAFHSRKYSPNTLMPSLPLPALSYAATPSNMSREEYAYAQAQAQHQKQVPQQYDSPGVPAAPFANAGPPGVHHMQYYSITNSSTGPTYNERSGHTYGYGY